KEVRCYSKQNKITIPELFLKIIFTIPSLEFSNKRIDGIVIFNQSNIGKNKVVLVIITQLFLFK
ncbi:hypothetical protein, partial [uncultured Gammaproteobacteria bacterium]